MVAKDKSGKSEAPRTVRQRIDAVRDRLSDKARTLPENKSNPVANIVLADIALRGGGMLLRRAVEKGILTIRYDHGRAKRLIKDRTLGQTLVSTALAKVATRSVPGAIVIGGGLVAKALFDRAKRNEQKPDDDAAQEPDSAA